MRAGESYKLDIKGRFFNMIVEPQFLLNVLNLRLEELKSVEVVIKFDIPGIDPEARFTFTDKRVELDLDLLSIFRRAFKVVGEASPKGNQIHFSVISAPDNLFEEDESTMKIDVTKVLKLIVETLTVVDVDIFIGIFKKTDENELIKKMERIQPLEIIKELNQIAQTLKTTDEDEVNKKIKQIIETLAATDEDEFVEFIIKLKLTFNAIRLSLYTSILNDIEAEKLWKMLKQKYNNAEIL